MRAKGFKTARRKSRQRVEKLDANVGDAIEATVTDVHATGRENIGAMLRKISGKLFDGYGKRISKKGHRGLVGYVTRRARENAFYARFVHDGTANAKAFPFHDLAVLEHEGRHKKRMRDASLKALDDRASPSSLARTGRGRERNLE
jgi:hypothetical protein